MNPEWFFSDLGPTFLLVSDPDPDPVSHPTWIIFFSNVLNILSCLVRVLVYILWRDIQKRFREFLFLIKRNLYFKLSIFVEKLSNLITFSVQIYFRFGADRIKIRNDFSVPVSGSSYKFWNSDPTGSGSESTTLISTGIWTSNLYIPLASTPKALCSFSLGVS